MFTRITEHLESVDESYFEHFSKAAGFSFTCIKLSVICFFHAILPFLFEHKASDEIIDLAECMKERRETD